MARLNPILLEFAPDPDGDNRIDVNVRERDIVATYLSSTNAPGNARLISIVFTDYYASRYFVTERHNHLCPGFGDCESDFASVTASNWLASLPDYVQTMTHFVFGLNHSLFECIAEAHRIECDPKFWHAENGG